MPTTTIFMKIIKSLIAVLLLMTTVVVLNSCGGESSNTNQTEQAAEQGKEYTSAYICPMHCEGSGAEAMGKCPVCGMDYVKNKDHKADGHSH